jgi:hypothetical protein
LGIVGEILSFSRVAFLYEAATIEFIIVFDVWWAGEFPGAITVFVMLLIP